MDGFDGYVSCRMDHRQTMCGLIQRICLVLRVENHRPVTGYRLNPAVQLARFMAQYPAVGVPDLASSSKPMSLAALEGRGNRTITSNNITQTINSPLSADSVIL